MAAVRAAREDAAGFAVEPVDERDLAAVRELVAQEIAEPVPERPRAARLRGMHEQPGRLVHGKKVRRLPEDLELFLSRIF